MHIVPFLVNPFEAASDQAQDEQDQEDKEKDLGNRSSTGSNTTEAEYRSDNSHYEKNYCPT
jgi:hypothetical protein